MLGDIDTQSKEGKHKVKPALAQPIHVMGSADNFSPQTNEKCEYGWMFKTSFFFFFFLNGNKCKMQLVVCLRRLKKGLIGSSRVCVVLV